MKISKRSLFPVAYFIALSLAFTGCGYSTRSLIANKYRTIYIEPFNNKIDITRDVDANSKYKIYKPMLETDITREVINKFLFDGNLKPVKSGASDLYLQGELSDFRREPLRYVEGTDEVEEYRIAISVNLVMKDLKNDSILWEERGFTGTTTYYTSYAPAQLTKKSDDTAVADAITDLARRIVERTVEVW